MAKVQVTVGLWRKAGDDALNTALGKIGIDNVANKVNRGWGGAVHSTLAKAETLILATLAVFLLCLGPPPVSATAQDRLLLIDASSFLYRAFHALPDLRAKSGAPTGALTGMINMLRRVQAEWPSRYVACVFDPKGPTFRDEIYSEYKANRASMPEDLAAQIAPVFDAVRALGWPLLQVPGVEADDVIGTLAKQASAKGLSTVIATGDKDLAQLVNDHVILIDTMSRDGGPAKVSDRAAVIEKFGVPPERIVDYLSLVGDTSDNVPGVEKVGPKTAAKWIAQYGSLEAVIAAADQVGGVVGENLRKALQWLPTAKVLVTVKTDCDLSQAVSSFDGALTFSPINQAEIARLKHEYQLDRSLRGIGESAATVPEISARVAASAASAAVGASAPQEPGVAAASLFDLQTQYTTVLEWTTFDALWKAITCADLVAVDTETTSIDARAAKIVGLSFSTEVGKGWYLPLGHDYAGVPDQLPAQEVLGKLKPWLEDASRKKVGQNLKYDQHVFAGAGIFLRGIAHDTLLESYVLEAHKSHDLDSLAQRHLGRKGLSYDDVTGKGAARIGFEQVAIDMATRYSSEDSDFTLHVHTTLWPQIQASPELLKVYESIEIPVAQVLWQMEHNGIEINAPLLEAQSEELAEKISALEAKAHDLAGQPFNLGSPKQLGEILFGKLGYAPVKKTATGAASTDEEVLEKLAEDYPLPRVLLEWRSLSKLKSTYCDKLPKMVDLETGRVHTTFSQAVAVTGRLASSDPNLQNIPVRTAEGRRIRQAFVAPAGYKLVSADYSQIELRIMAHLSQDAGLVKAFQAGEDVHKATASEVFGVPLDQVSAEQRRYAKVINFGLIYGMSAFGLARNLDIDRGVAKNYIDQYFSKYPGVARYMEDIRQAAKAQGYVETVFGRRLWLPEINSPNGPSRQAAERAAINAPMQGTAADLIKLAMIEVQHSLEKEKLRSRLVLQVHDELVLEVPQTEVETIRSLLHEKMVRVASLRVPLLVEVGVGDNWDEAH
jgi:DNA polymerase I